MVYTDEEQKRWWTGLTNYERLELLGTMIDRMDHSEFALSISAQYSRGFPLSGKQIAVIRKWHRE